MAPRGRRLTANGVDIFDGDAIIDQKVGNDGETLYLLTWEGYRRDKASWEPEHNIGIGILNAWKRQRGEPELPDSESEDESSDATVDHSEEDPSIDGDGDVTMDDALTSESQNEDQTSVEAEGTGMAVGESSIQATIDEHNTSHATSIPESQNVFDEAKARKGRSESENEDGLDRRPESQSNKMPQSQTTSTPKSDATSQAIQTGNRNELRGVDVTIKDDSRKQSEEIDSPAHAQVGDIEMQQVVGIEGNAEPLGLASDYADPDYLDEPLPMPSLTNILERDMEVAAGRGGSSITGLDEYLPGDLREDIDNSPKW